MLQIDVMARGPEHRSAARPKRTNERTKGILDRSIDVEFSEEGNVREGGREWVRAVRHTYTLEPALLREERDDVVVRGDDGEGVGGCHEEAAAQDHVTVSITVSRSPEARNLVRLNTNQQTITDTTNMEHKVTQHDK